ncbi:hypothetical protein ACWD25_07475 [Streptomyces sp. NPDC002920]
MTPAVETRITDEALISTLRQVVAERPEYVYVSPKYMGATDESGSCFYVHTDDDGSPVSAGCAIGVVLNRLGVSLEELLKGEGTAAYALIGKLVPGVGNRVRAQLYDMQMNQDNGDPWGLAYAKATGETI